MSTLHTLSVLVEDRPGVLTRVAGLFAARGFNIDSLAVGPTEEPGLSRMTIVVDVVRKPLEQVTKQLNKLINVFKILEHEPGDSVERELMLVKVRAEGEMRARVYGDLRRLPRAASPTSRTRRITIEATGSPAKLESFLALLEDFGVVESARTGRIALVRGDLGIPERVLKAAKAAGGEERTGVGRRRGDERGPRDSPKEKTMATIYYEKDTDRSALAGDTIAVLGFGSQGHAHAQNLKDSGFDMRVGLRPGSSSRAAAEAAGLRVLDIADAVREADVIMVLLPEHVTREGVRRRDRTPPRRPATC